MTALTNLLERLSKLERAGTVAQWQVRGAYVVQAPRITRDVCRVCSHLSTADGELIAAARNSLPTLLQMLRVASEAMNR